MKIFCKWSHRSAHVWLAALPAITPCSWDQDLGAISGNVSDLSGAVISGSFVNQLTRTYGPKECL